MVRRARRADGAAFLGCSRYPACRGTRDQAADRPNHPESQGMSPPPPPAAPAFSPPGSSARARFEDLESKHIEAVNRRRPWIIARGIAIGLVGLILAVLGGTLAVLGTSLVFLAVVWTIGALVVLPDGVRAWRTGAVGEEMTAAALAALPAGAFVVLHDRRKPRSRANIDHLVVGPTGVWVVETKNYGGSLAVRDGDLWIGGRRKTAFIDQVKSQAGAVSTALGGVPVLPIICVHRADFPLLGRAELRGVRIVGSHGLVEAISTAPIVLRPDEVTSLSRLADERLAPALR
jgi:hypothetical protein